MNQTGENHPPVTVVPIESGDGNENDEDNDENARFTPAIARNKRNSLSHTRSTVAKANALHNDHIMHEKGFQQKTEKRQQRAKRKTQLRLQARIRLKDSKALHKLPIFAALDDKEVDTLIDVMDHIVRLKGDLICRQHDVSDSFYIIVKGAASVSVDDENKKTGEIRMDETGLRPKQVVVGDLCSLKFFGESALIMEEDGLDSLRNATVTVSSEKCVLLRLKRSNFIKLIESDEHMFKDKHEDSESVIAQVKQTKLERSQSNRNILENRGSSVVGEGGGVGGGVGIKSDVPDGDEEEEEDKMVPLERPKGLPNLNGLSSNNKRSLFN